MSIPDIAWPNLTNFTLLGVTQQAHNINEH